MYGFWYYYELDSLNLAETGENEERFDWDTWGGESATEGWQLSEQPSTNAGE